MPRLPRVTAEELLHALRRDGWYEVSQRGSHVHLQHPSKQGTVTVPKHAGATIKFKALITVLDQAGLSLDELRRLL